MSEMDEAEEGEVVSNRKAERPSATGELKDPFVFDPKKTTRRDAHCREPRPIHSKKLSAVTLSFNEPFQALFDMLRRMTPLPNDHRNSAACIVSPRALFCPRT